MKTRKQALSALLFALLGIALLAGCSMDGDGDPDDSNGGGTSADSVITAATAEPITESELIGTWTCNYMFEGIDNTHTLKFESSGNVAYFYENDYGSGNKTEGSYTYTVDGSTVTIIGVYSDGDEDMQLTYLSGQLVEVGMIYTPADSSGGNTISLAGTTWTLGDDTYSETLKFDTNGNVTRSVYETIYNAGEIESTCADTYTYAYTVSGYTVTISAGGQSLQLIYSSGKLIYPGLIFTKGG